VYGVFLDQSYIDVYGDRHGYNSFNDSIDNLNTILGTNIYKVKMIQVNIFKNFKKYFCQMKN